MSLSCVEPKRISYWLVPQTEDLESLQLVVDQLAANKGGPKFLPHLTIYNGSYSKDDVVEDIVRRAAEGKGPLTLQVSGIEFSSRYTQTLFLAFESDPSLASLSDSIRSSSIEPSDYQLKPHLSLMYNSLEDAELESLSNDIQNKLPKSVTFDRIVVVPAEKQTTSKEDVEAWEVSFEAQL